jgi:nitrogen fixation NifU-like protein
MDELQELYREVILDHNRNPRNFGELADATRVVAGVNPLCGDKMTLYVKVAGDTIEDIRFRGTGCAISVASSSLMTERVKGAPVAEALALFERVHELLTSPAHDHPQGPDGLEKLAALGGVREYPSRVKCASLAWHALKSAIGDELKTNVTTE